MSWCANGSGRRCQWTKDGLLPNGPLWTFESGKDILGCDGLSTS
jgi:hypothetical protein